MIARREERLKAFVYNFFAVTPILLNAPGQMKCFNGKDTLL